MQKNFDLSFINIRNCRKNDYEFIHNLSKKNMENYVKECWGKWDSQKFKANFKKKNIKIINYNKRKIGFFDITRKDSMAYLNNIQIIDFFQGKGIGKNMMDLIEKGEKMAGAKKIRLQVFKKNPARLFYRKLGYTTIERDVHSVIMKKNL